MLSASNRTLLQDMLAADYESLVRKLTGKFGCADFASETLHETFARLDGISDTTLVQSPRDYLFRSTINVGKNRRRSERLRASAAEIDAVLDVPDEMPTPAQTVESRSDMDALLRVLEELPIRTRQAFEAALFDNKPYSEIADTLGVSLRTVERDIQRAIEFCASRIGHVPARRLDQYGRRS